MLWYQGESDACDASLAAGYGPKLRWLLAALRRDLCRPALPVGLVLCHCAAERTRAGLAAVRAAQARVAAAEAAAGTGWAVDAAGLAPVDPDNCGGMTIDGLLQPDGLHLATPAQVALGESLAAGFKQLVAARRRRRGGRED